MNPVPVRSIGRWSVIGFLIAATVASGTAAERTVVLQLPFTHQFQFAGYYVAQYKGYYAEEGLAVELRPNKSDRPAIAEVAEGRAQYGVFQGSALLESWMQGQDFALVATVMQHSPFALLVSADSKIYTPKDLLGRRVALDSNLSVTEVQLMLEREGLDAKKLIVVPNHWNVNEVAVGAADAMDGFLTDEPYDLRTEGFPVRLIRPRDYGVDFYGDCLFSTATYLRSHSEEAKAFRRASLRGWTYALQHPDEVGDWIVAHLPDRPAKVTRERMAYEALATADLIDAQLVELGHTNPGRWQSMADTLRRQRPAFANANLDEFLFFADQQYQLPHWVRWLGWSLGTLLVLFLLALLANERLRRIAEKRAVALKTTETRYRELFENAAGGIFRSTPAGEILEANPAFAELLGWPSLREFMDFARQNNAAALWVDPKQRAEFTKLIQTTDRVKNYEIELRRFAGDTVWTSANTRVVRDEAGRVQFFEGFVTDLTAHRRLETELIRASKLEAVGILAGGIAHDFNNILTVVLGNLSMLLMDTDPKAPGYSLVRDAKLAAVRARDLTLQLLTFAKGGDPVRTVINLSEVLRESVGFAMHGAKSRAVFDLADNLWSAHVDRGQIGQVVQNLAINAVQSMPDGGTVTVRADNFVLGHDALGDLPAGFYVRLSFADTGVGITPEHLGSIFDPYFTTKPQGSGLGLATVYSIVRKHGGYIDVESKPGAGTRFTVWLPAAPDGEVEAGGAAPIESVLRGRILFMDDELPICEMAGKLLTKFGVDFIVARDGGEAVSRFRDALQAGRPFDLLIMDLTVPGAMGGDEAMQQIRALHPSVRAIVSSGYSRDPVMANYQAHGFCAVLPKPYSPEQMYHAIQTALAKPWFPS